MTSTRPASRHATNQPGSRKTRRAYKKELPGRRFKWFRRVLIVASFLLFTIVAVIGGAVAIAWSTMQLPPEAPLAQTTFLTDANGAQLSQFNAGENRVPVKLGDVPPVVIHAVLDTEDHKYFTHKGIDPEGTARALLNDLNHKSELQGGSTITQQYVKNVYVGDKRTPVRKLKEAVLALKLERKYTKNEILERYLNVIYFGRGAYGIETASKAYFGKDVQHLGLPEASYLAGLIRAPELADAYAQPVTAKNRRDLTLGNMARFGDITPAEQARVTATALTGAGGYVVSRSAEAPQTQEADKGTQYFVDYVKQILVKRYGEQMVDSGGLRVKTSLDLKSQAKAYDSIYGFLKPGEPAGALVSIDQNGNVVAMVGGRDYKQSQVNLAVGSEGGGQGRAAGSTFKPFMLAAALENGVQINETFAGPGKLVIPGWDAQGSSVSNYGFESFGNLDLIDATVHSVNTIYAQLVVKEGVERLINMAHEAGVTSQLQPDNSLVLGVDDVSPLDMADAYLTFAQGGVRVTPNPILEVRDSDGQVLERAKPQRTRVMSEETADMVNYVLQQVVLRGTGTAAQVGKPIAGKTGTTENEGDAWFVGYRPNLSTAVWMGYPQGSRRAMTSVRGIAVTGGTFPAQMFSNYMRWAVKKDDNAKFTMPTDFGTTTQVPYVSSPPTLYTPFVPTTPTTSTTLPTAPSGTTPIGLGDIRPRGRRGNSTTTAPANAALPPKGSPIFTNSG